MRAQGKQKQKKQKNKNRKESRRPLQAQARLHINCKRVSKIVYKTRSSQGEVKCCLS